MKENIKLSFLWVAIVAGMSSHSLMDVMPLFWNADIAISKDGVAPVSMLVMMAVVSFTLPITGLSVATRWYISVLQHFLPYSVRYIARN